MIDASSSEIAFMFQGASLGSLITVIIMVLAMWASKKFGE